jgi:predicted metalloprotease with PDZ domain
MSRYFLAAAFLLAFSANTQSQVTIPTGAATTEASIAVVSISPPRVKIEGSRGTATKAWSFRNSYAGIMNLGERVENLSLADAQGAGVPVRRLAPGEYEAAREAVRFSYEIRLDPPASNTDAAHVSWLTTDRGALMPGDLLPLPLARARLSFKLPEGWRLVSPDSTLAPKGDGGKPVVPDGPSAALVFEDADSAILFAGLGVRERAARVSGMDVRVAVAGEWAFTDEEVGGAVASILREHAKTFGGVPGSGALVVLAPPPHPATFSEWSAETRGATIFCLSGRAPSRASALARTETPLAHELFHLWIPNALSLAGDYAWFYEGFTNYQALRASQRLGFLNFDDYLAALARAYDGYEPLRDGDTLPLVEASQRRWSGANALVYHKGMLAAAIYDLQLRAATRGRRSLDDVYRELLRRARAGSGTRDGDALVLDVLKDVAAGEDFAARLVAVAHKIELGAELSPFGVKVETLGARHQLGVSNSLTGSQRDLLRQIGYNGR